MCSIYYGQTESTFYLSRYAQMSTFVAFEFTEGTLLKWTALVISFDNGIVCASTLYMYIYKCNVNWHVYLTPSFLPIYTFIYIYLYTTIFNRHSISTIQFSNYSIYLIFIFHTYVRISLNCYFISWRICHDNEVGWQTFNWKSRIIILK